MARILLCLAIAIVLLCSPASAQQLSGFGPFVEEQTNEVGSYSVVDDPTGYAPEQQVYSFHLTPGDCNDKIKYGYGKNLTDCSFKSLRSQVFEKTKSQPASAWYEWSMYLADDFPIGHEQGSTGFYTFAYWHSGYCPHVALVSETDGPGVFALQTYKFSVKDNIPCQPDTRIEIGDLRAYRGAWHRFEVFVKWDKGPAGVVDVFIDGERAAIYHGRTITANVPKANYFKAGIYLCCTKGTHEISPALAYYTAFKREDSRDGLYTESDRKLIGSLQASLAKIGCPTSDKDGVVGDSTRQAALTCRSFPNDELPHELSPGNLSRFLDLYSRPEVAALPAGGQPAPTPLPAPPQQLEIHVAQIESVGSGKDDEAIATFRGIASGKGAPKSLDFVLTGHYLADQDAFRNLDILMVGDIGTPTKAFLACPGQRTETWDTGVQAVVMLSGNRGTNYSAPGAKCIISALPKGPATQTKFILEHFQDIAASMVIDGSADLIKHDGLRSLIKRAAFGDVQVLTNGLPEGTVPVKYIAHAVDQHRHDSDNPVKVNTDFVATVDRNPEIREFDFSVLGSYSSSLNNFTDLSLLLNGNVATDAEADACSGSSIAFPDGSRHIMIQFSRVMDDFVSPNAACLLGALTGEQLAVVRVLVTNFSDIAVGMIADGTIDDVGHKGLQAFLRRVAFGEVKVGAKSPS